MSAGMPDNGMEAIPHVEDGDAAPEAAALSEGSPEAPPALGQASQSPEAPRSDETRFQSRRNFVNVAAVEPSASSVVREAAFIEHPPSQIRKPNFFHFALQFRDAHGRLISFRQARFVAFIASVENQDAAAPEDERGRKAPCCNGILYELMRTGTDDMAEPERIIVRLVDIASGKPVPYEGLDRDPDLQRVLITHEVTCARCNEGRSCGNKTEAPSDPVLSTDGRSVRFFMKCNQNCLKIAGNPRENRRFRIAVSRSTAVMPPDLLTVSEPMFVHNNSKHGRRSAFATSRVSARRTIKGEPADDHYQPPPPMILHTMGLPSGRFMAVSPTTAAAVREQLQMQLQNGRGDEERHVAVEAVIALKGPLQGDEEINVVGAGFLPGMYVFLAKDGQTVESLATELVSPHLLVAQAPARHIDGPLDVRIGSESVRVVMTHSLPYYCSASEEHWRMRDAVERLSRIVPYVEGDTARLPMSVAVVRAAEVLERLAEYGQLTRGRMLGVELGDSLAGHAREADNGMYAGDVVGKRASPWADIPDQQQQQQQQEQSHSPHGLLNGDSAPRLLAPVPISLEGRRGRTDVYSPGRVRPATSATLQPLDTGQGPLHVHPRWTHYGNARAAPRRTYGHTRSEGTVFEPLDGYGSALQGPYDGADAIAAVQMRKRTRAASDAEDVRAAPRGQAARRRKVARAESSRDPASGPAPASSDAEAGHSQASESSREESIHVDADHGELEADDARA